MAALARSLLALSALLCLSLPGRAQEADEHAAHHHGASDVLLFASAQATRFSPRSPSSDLNEDARFAGDVVFTFGQGGLRLFGELLLSGEEHDLERLQLGYEFGANTVAWLGRFHQPASAWNRGIL